MGILELRQASMEFRRKSSNLLNSTHDDADVNLARFIKCIDETPVISDIVQNAIAGIAFDFEECFIRDGWQRISIPVDEKCHLKAQYDYAKFLLNNKTNANLRNDAFQANRSFESSKIQKYISSAFKPLIDYIIDSISNAIIIEEEKEKAATTIVQNIEHNYGTANIQGNGSIVSTNNINTSQAEILALISSLMDSLSSAPDTLQSDVDDVRDDLESIQEQIVSEKPKKNRIQKALDRIKEFAKKVKVELVVNEMADGIESTNWAALIEKVETFLTTLG